jgi:endoglucanase
MKKRMYVVCSVLMLLLVSACIQGCAGRGTEETPQQQEQKSSEADADVEIENSQIKPTEGKTAPSITGALHVEGTQLCGSDGSPVQLRGISTHGIAWFPEYINAECFRELHEQWNANVVRLAMYTAESGGYCTDGNKEELKERIRSGVKYAQEQDMYVIIDWHILSDADPNEYLAEAKSFFAEISGEYAKSDHVLYEICNEPNGNTSWQDIKSYAQEIISVIRSNDPDGVVLVGTPNWSQFVDEAAADPITGYDNLMYTLHFYAATHTDDLRGRLAAAIENGLPVFVSEYGICDASGSGAIDVAQAEQWISLLDQYQISYVVWNLSNKEETSALLKSSCDKVNGFEETDLSDSGKWVYNMLQENAVL